jgi:choline dehydrogenase-like flavoprotein
LTKDGLLKSLHPYDKRVAIEALRCPTEFSEVPAFEKVTARRIEGPSKNADDVTLWEHCKKAVAPVWHFAGTCKMGRDGDEAAVVDKEFRVKGVEGLRVVDLSVLPVLPNNHTQSTAYLVGETGAEKLIAEYGL